MSSDTKQSKQSTIHEVSVSLPYNEKVLIHLWYNRNPCHEDNSDTGEDMFWKTVFMVMKDYIREVGSNEH